MKRVIRANSSGWYVGEPNISPDLWARNAQAARNSKISRWQDAYALFQEIIDKYFPDEDKIDEEVFNLYESNRSNPAFREAWRRWNEE